jgi:hypothetical protein
MFISPGNLNYIIIVAGNDKQEQEYDCRQNYNGKIKHAREGEEGCP